MSNDKLVAQAKTCIAWVNELNNALKERFRAKLKAQNSTSIDERIRTLRKQIADAAECLLDAAARESVDCSNLRAVLDGRIGYPIPLPEQAAALRELDVLRRKLKRPVDPADGLNVSEASRATGIPKGTITKWCNNGKVKSTGKGRERRVDMNSLTKHRNDCDDRADQKP